MSAFILVGYSLGGNLVLNNAANHHGGMGYGIKAVLLIHHLSIWRWLRKPQSVLTTAFTRTGFCDQ